MSSKQEPLTGRAPQRPPCHIRIADRCNGTHVLMEPHPNGERYIEIDSQEVWNLEDME